MVGMSPRSRGRKGKPRRASGLPAPTPRALSDAVAHAIAVQSATSTAPRLSADRPLGRAQLSLTTLNCDRLRDLEPRGLGMTYCFDTSRWTESGRVTIRFDGRVAGSVGNDATSSFTVTDTVDVPARAGKVTVTARAPNLAAGVWRVTATASVDSLELRTGQPRVWRLPTATADGVPAFEPVMRVRAPGARLGIWPALVLTGALLAFATQLLIAPHLHVPAWRLVAVSVAASLVGLVASKAYYKLLHPDEAGGLVSTGLGIQGFVLGAVGTLLAGSAIAGFPLLRGLDAIAPGLLLGMTVGRLGCFFGGCCAGRPTAGRGLWSSDRHVGIRRIPVQLFESAVAGSVAFAALSIDIARSAPAGVVFTGALAAYALGRQLLFPIRDIPRQTRHGRRLMIAVTASILLIDITLALAA